MSRYVVNKLMRTVNMDPVSLADYRADGPGYVRAFRAAQRAAGHEDLTENEVGALERYDYGALYAMGAHPYLLWSFIEAVLVPPMARAELVQSFREAATPAGYPDCATTPPPGGEHR